MSIFDGIRSFLTIGEPPPPSAALQTRSLEQMIIQVTGYDPSLRPWRRATTGEAMAVPAVFKALSLISNTIGTLNMEVFRNGALLAEDATPMVVVRPDPFNPPHVFWRDSAFYKALTGEHWWYVAKRDSDGAAISLINVDPREIIVERNRRNSLRPVITWNNEEMRNDDMVQVMYLRDPENPLRGIGPLQACRAAISVAVEAQEWAANWFAGAPAQTVIKSAVDIDVDEAATLKAQWMAGAGNLPKVIDPGIESVTELGGDPEKAQLSQSRLHQNGEVALMYSMPPSLLNYAISGSQITYQNVGQVADDFLRQCLRPHYLEGMEQAMSDLLARRSIGRFNAASLVLADIKTRFEVYGVGIDKGIFGPEYAAQAEGITAGGIENRPVPFAPPAAIPTSLPVQLRSVDGTRCGSCGKKHLDEIAAPYRWTCPRCKHVNEAAAAAVETRDAPSVTIAEGAIKVQSPVTVTTPERDDSVLRAVLDQIAAVNDRLDRQEAQAPAPQRVTQQVRRDTAGRIIEFVQDVA